MSGHNFEVRNEIFGDEVRQGGEGFRISGAELVPLGHLVQGSVVVRNLSLELIEMTHLEEESCHSDFRKDFFKQRIVFLLGLESEP